MPNYTDFQLVTGKYDKAEEFNDSNAIVLAIRNILLSRPGNFPFNPSVGLNIKKYQFDLLDDNEIDMIQKELDKDISLFVPDADLVNTVVTKVEGDDGKVYLGISISANISGEDTTVNFIISKEENEVKIFNEIY